MRPEAFPDKGIEPAVADGVGLYSDAALPFGIDPDPMDGEPFWTSSRKHGRAGGTGPVAQVREELALWISAPMKDVVAMIMGAAVTDVAVLITGETGTGKDLVARALHYLGRRRGASFVKVNCAGLTRELLESELFGVEPRPLLDPHERRIGKFEAARGGTIFLDEIGDLHPALQTKLLDVVENAQFSRVGGRSHIPTDVRVIAATNRDLDAAVDAGEFRKDLFYRLNAIRIVVPPLRQRVEEIPLLANHFVARYASLFQREGFTLSDETLKWLQQHPFPGNVRELENMVKRAIVLHDLDLDPSPRGRGRAGSLRATKRTGRAEGSLRDISRKAARAAEQGAIMKALEETRWNRLRAARLLKISYRSLLYKIKEAGMTSKPKGPDPA
jgi:DNA-binding NtrC family response regulator